MVQQYEGLGETGSNKACSKACGKACWNSRFCSLGLGGVAGTVQLRVFSALSFSM